MHVGFGGGGEVAHVFILIAKSLSHGRTMWGTCSLQELRQLCEGSLLQEAPARPGALVTNRPALTLTLSGKKSEGGVWIPVLWRNASNPLLELHNVLERELWWTGQHGTSRHTSARWWRVLKVGKRQEQEQDDKTPTWRRWGCYFDLQRLSWLCPRSEDVGRWCWLLRMEKGRNPWWGYCQVGWQRKLDECCDYECCSMTALPFSGEGWGMITLESTFPADRLCTITKPE